MNVVRRVMRGINFIVEFVDYEMSFGCSVWLLNVG